MIISSIAVSISMYIPRRTVYTDHILIADVKGKWEKSSWGKKLIVQKTRASLNDFDRFKVMLAKIKVCPASILQLVSLCTLLLINLS